MTNASRVCTECGATVFADAPEGVCSVCLFRTGLASLDNKDDEPFQNGQADLLVGRTIGHYKLSEQIGTGGMGDVYLATDITAGRKAALKLLPTRFTGDTERLKRFRQEARAVVRLNHPNILTIYEIGEDHSTHYIASELIEGETLRQRLMRGRMQLSEAVDIAIQVASALAAAHEAGIVHRDIKPENIMLRPDGYVKVLDFGIAKLAEQEVPITIPKDEAVLLVETNLGSILGTVRYMSPEQACGAQVDKATDIWSLGVVLYEMVTGHAPFTGDTPREVMSSILEKEPPPLTRYAVRASAELQQIINKTLRKDRRQRYHSAGELREALKDLRRKLELESLSGNGFFEEVKRRKVYRVAAAYIIASAGIIQLASAAFPAWELPNWALRLVIVLLLIGFPLTLILGWVFDVTAQGVRATPGTRPRRSVIVLVAAGVIISAVAGFFLLPRVSAHKVDKSIAVLPFENLSKDEENAFFADGVQDEILSDLAKVADLKVISRTSVTPYKSGVARNLRQIGQQLGVAHVVEGSVQRTGNRVRVNAQLVDARTDRHLWGQTYDRELADVFAIQSEIAKTIADQLQAKLSPSEKNAIERPPTSDIGAFDLYARAKVLLHVQSPGTAGDLQAVDLLNRAVARDPSFFDAYCQLAYADGWLYFLGFDHTSARLALAEAALQAASRLHPDAGETHLARAQNLYWGYLDYDGALAELEVARQTLPNDSRVFELKGYIQRRQGHWEESTRNLERVAELDPRDIETMQLGVAANYWHCRRYAEAKRWFARGLAFDPNDAVTKVWLALVDFAWKADTRPLHQTIESIRATNPAAVVPDIAQWWLYCALAERDGTAAKDALIASGDAVFFTHNVPLNRPFIEGVIARMIKDNEKARSAFSAARAEQEKIVQAQPNYGPALCVLGLIDAGLGRKEEALREGRRAVELLPVEKDAIEGSAMIEYLATIAAWIGDKNLACEQLASIIRRPSSLSYGQLKLLPLWDPLRGDPRFEKLVEEAKQPFALK
jgi:TolB-like protein/Tfp pilus assembly protein PilF